MYLIFTEENYPESVDQLRQRLEVMKRMMADRNLDNENARRNQSVSSNIIDGSFLSIVFGIALVVIITVSIYAFYNLYHAILKKFPSHHTEL